MRCLEVFKPTGKKKKPFLHYNEANDVVFCHVCMSATKNKMIRSNNADPAFVSAMYCNYMHLASNIHLLTYKYYLNTRVMSQLSISAFCPFI